MAPKARRMENMWRGPATFSADQREHVAYIGCFVVGATPSFQASVLDKLLEAMNKSVDNDTNTSAASEFENRWRSHTSESSRATRYPFAGREALNNMSGSPRAQWKEKRRKKGDGARVLAYAQEASDSLLERDRPSPVLAFSWPPSTAADRTPDDIWKLNAFAFLIKS